jgi:hypothetical protein
MSGVKAMRDLAYEFGGISCAQNKSNQEFQTSTWRFASLAARQSIFGGCYYYVGLPVPSSY